MFTPQNKPWSGWSLTPRREHNGSGTGHGSELVTSNPRNGEMFGRDKGLAFNGSPPNNSAAEEYATMDKEALGNHLAKLQNELFDYQYNMGLLLIEKKEWNSKYEALRQDLAVTSDAIRREKAEHLTSMSEAEKREENLRKALGVEKQCVIDLEKALRELHSEYAEIKFTSDSKLAEAESLVTSVNEKSLEVEAKLRALDAKHAEVSRKASEIERKSQELMAQENALRRDRSSFIAERETHEESLSKQRDDLREWEKRLQEGEERLAETRRLLNQREQRVNENDRIWKQKEKELENAQLKVDATSLALKKSEEDIRSRLANLATMEKEADSTRKSLEVKEKELLELQDKLNAREKVEMQKLLDEHKALLGAKEKEFELEMEEKNKAMDENLKSRQTELQKKEVEFNHMEEKIRKREQALDRKLEKMKDREGELESKSKALKEREKSLKVEEVKLENDRKQILSDKESVLAEKSELEKTRSDIENRHTRIREEREQLKVTEDERSEHTRLQLELKQEIDKCRLQREQLLRETEDLKQERLRFEREWEDLDAKSAQIKKEFEDIAEERKQLEKLRESEEERLKNEKLEAQSYVRGELEALNVAKGSFAASMEHEKSMLDEKLRLEKTKMLHDFEMQKRELETELQGKKDKMEFSVYEREKSFQEERDRELSNISFLKEKVQREMEEMKLERLAINKEKKEILTNKEHLEMQQVEMRKDIDSLVSLSRKVKDTREQFINERERFIDFVEKQNSCVSCAELIHEFLLSDLKSLTEIDNIEVPSVPSAAENYLKEAIQGTSEKVEGEVSPGVAKLSSPASGGMSWLRKCTTKIFGLSPGKKVEAAAAQDQTDVSFSRKLDNIESQETMPDDIIHQELSFEVAGDSLAFQQIQSDNSIREVEPGPDHSVDDQWSQQSDAKASQRGRGKKGRPRVNKTRSVKAVVAEARVFLGEAPAEDGSQHVDGTARDSDVINKESMGEPENQRNGRKRNRVHTSATVSEHDENSGRSDSVTGEGHKRRRQKAAPPVQAPGEKRYNLRRPRVAAAAVANGTVSNHDKGKEREIDVNVEAAPSNNVDVHGDSHEEIRDSSAAPATSVGPAKGEDDAVESIKPVLDYSADSPIRFNIEADTEEGIHTTNNLVGDLHAGEEGYGTPKGAGEDEEEEDEEAEEVDHPGEVSIGKKLWTFLTT